MFLAFRLAYRNLIGAGLRTWLNVIVLSFSFVVIIWMQGLLIGWDHQAKNDIEKWEIGQGQFWHNNYDPYDPFTFSDSYAPLPENFNVFIESGLLVPVLVTPGSIFPEGRMQSVTIKGIPKNQNLLSLPTYKLDTLTDAIPVIIGINMARKSHLKRGDITTLRWRDKMGTFDAAQIIVADIFATNVPAVDAGQIWIDIEVLRNMMLLQNQATFITFGKDYIVNHIPDNFILKTKRELTAEIDEMIKLKSSSQPVFYFVLLLLAMLAIFDTQVLSIFRRQKEIGTYVALGYTRKQVVLLFTIEGAMHAVLAAMLAMVYGIPFFIWQSKSGFTIPMDASEFGLAMAQTLYPVYNAGLVIVTTLIVFLTTTIVSYWPSRRIAKMNPTDALRGKIQ